ncbi:hypothetical protein D3C71_1556300 [compost metagenome]|jgi:hypothetical protein
MVGLLIKEIAVWFTLSTILTVWIYCERVELIILTARVVIYPAWLIFLPQSLLLFSAG